MHQTRENGWGASTDNNDNSKENVTRQKVNEQNNLKKSFALMEANIILKEIFQTLY